VLQYYLAGWHIKPKGVKKPCVFTPDDFILPPLYLYCAVFAGRYMPAMLLVLIGSNYPL
jgi:hypothetical protein